MGHLPWVMMGLALKPTSRIMNHMRQQEGKRKKTFFQEDRTERQYSSGKV
jgi:hypothetical protein